MYDKITNEDLEQLFDGTLLRYNNIPVRVRAHGDGMIRITSIGGNEYEDYVVKVVDRKLNTTPVPLGYCNVGGYTYHVSRMPARRFSVGLTSKNMSIKAINGLMSDRGINDLSAMRTKGLRDCILGIYPTLGEAIDKLQEKEAWTVGVDRSFAIDRDHCLYFKDQRVGLIERDNKPIFFNTKTYLKVLWEQGYAGTRA